MLFISAFGAEQIVCLFIGKQRDAVSCVKVSRRSKERWLTGSVTFELLV